MALPLLLLGGGAAAFLLTAAGSGGKRKVSAMSDPALDQIAAGRSQMGPRVGAALDRLLFLNGSSYSVRKADYLTMWPFDTPSDADGMAKSQSSCGIATENAWRAAGEGDPRLYQTYKDRLAKGGTSYAVSLEKDIATKKAAWVDTVTYADDGTKRPEDLYPEVGDALIVGCASCPGTWATGTSLNTEHEFTVGALALPANGQGLLLHSIDGGLPGVGVRTRALVAVPGRRELWVASIKSPAGDYDLRADGRPVNGRRVMGWSKLNRLVGEEPARS